MIKKKLDETAVPRPPARNVITGCTFTNQAVAANEHTMASVVALANAAKANADAIAACARCLQGPVFDGTTISIGGDRV